ncbi:MAG: FAD-dependent oxidoreductase [Oscillospiraceae bacterium]|nr:FAD-dependent oxidoreductase [Oscillospiraceae bacterium]
MNDYRYAHLMAPLPIRDLILKNRMLATCCLPHFLQGPETFPSESILAFVEGIAKAGAAIVTIPDRFDNTRMVPMEDVKRGPCWDPQDPSVDNYLSQLCEAVHFQGSYITAQLSKFHSIPRDVGVYDHEEVPGPKMMTGLEPPPPPMPVKAITREQMDLLSDEIVSRAKYYQSVGFDGIVLHCAYAYNVLAKFLPASTNLRTDEFGGCIENRAKFPLSVVRRVREACGGGFYIEMQMSGDCMPEEELVRFAHLCEGLVDVLHIRLMDMDGSHASTFSYDGVSMPKSARYAERIKRSGAKVLVAPNGGFHDPDRNERLIAEGKTDLIALARPFICDPDYGRKIQEERAEDIIPCLYCNKCHHNLPGQWASGCRLNPVMGIAHRIGPMTDTASGRSKRVAIIGGGPAGMRAALMAAERGHQVTLYERSGALGGQLRHADYAAFKWALRNYKDYLIDQLDRRDNVQILLNTPAQPEDIAAQSFDAVIAACGASPAVPPIPGVETTPCWLAPAVFGHEAELGDRVVVIGGSETGVETGMYLAEAGHTVTVLTRSKYLARDGWSVHAYSLMKRRWEDNPSFTGLTEVVTRAIAPGAVTILQDGEERTLECDAIVLSGGVKSNREEALRFSGCARQFFVIGDCGKAENLQHCNRSALAAVSKL